MALAMTNLTLSDSSLFKIKRASRFLHWLYVITTSHYIVALVRSAVALPTVACRTRVAVQLLPELCKANYIEASAGLRRNHVRHSLNSHTTKIWAALKIEE